MKVCSQCGAVYEARVEFCFKDGNPLQAAPEAAHVLDSADESGIAPASLPADPVSPAAAFGPPPGASGALEDAPDPMSLPAARSLSDVFDVPEPRFAPLRGADAEGGGRNTTSNPVDLPLQPHVGVPAETAPLSAAEEVLAPARALDAELGPDVDRTDEALAPPTPIDSPRTRPLVRPPRPAYERTVPGAGGGMTGLSAPIAEPPSTADVGTSPAAAEPKPDLSGFAAMPDAPDEDDLDALPDVPPRATSGAGLMVLVGIAAAALLLVAGGAWWFSRSAPTTPPPEPLVEVAPDPPPPPAPPPPPPPPEPEPEPEVEPEPEAPLPAPVVTAPKPRPERAPARRRARPKPKPSPPPPPPDPPAEADANPWGAGAGEPVTDGLLAISTTPQGATVTLDGEVVGKAPLERRVPYGNHMVKVELDGFETASRSLNVVSETLSVPFELRAATMRGRVALFGVQGSTVDIDGSTGGRVPFQIALEEGTHLFKVTLPSGETFTTSREVRFGPDGRTVTLNLSAP